MDTDHLGERVHRLPGMDALLPALVDVAPTFLVGGAVRDLLRGASAVDLDVAVEGDAHAVAGVLAQRLHGEAHEHEHFGTATVRSPALTVDLAATRTETYAEPGALPSVTPASLDEDLGRRDFAINAMAIALRGDDLGHLYDPWGGQDDLDAGLVRVLHANSFVDDPTRLLRVVRYSTRLGFAIEPSTERLARAAIEARALGTVSGARIRDELMDLLRETEAPSAVQRLRDLDIPRALHPALDPDVELVASALLGAVAIEADPGVAALAAFCAGAPEELEPWLTNLHLPASERDAALRAAWVAQWLASELRREEHSPSQLRALLGTEPPAALALALALRAPSEDVLRWVTDLSHVRLEIGGDDLIAAGMAPGPELGRVLEETLKRKLDGEVGGRDEELRMAVELAR
jgi:tRNA nucleotidyltransferase (CCA-adding enzyme)